MVDERTIIPIEEVHAATQQELDVAALRDFVAHWTPEEMPACPEGMALLHYFSLKYPSPYEVARQKRFTDPPPAVSRTAGSHAYCEHVSHCADCSEGGAQPIPYDGPIHG